MPTPDDLTRLLRERRSIRRFRDEPVPEALVETILEAARWAPTAGNRQAFRLIGVVAPEVIAAMGDAVREAVAALIPGVRAELRDGARAYLDNFSLFAGAPVVIAPIYRAGPDLLASLTGAAETPASADDAIASVSAVTTYLLLAAHAAGLGACWMTGPRVAAPALRAILAVPAGWAIAGLIPLGVPAEQPAAPPRRPLRELVRWIRAPRGAT
jgi:nitroreductase